LLRILDFTIRYLAYIKTQSLGQTFVAGYFFLPSGIFYISVFILSKTQPPVLSQLFFQSPRFFNNITYYLVVA